MPGDFPYRPLCLVVTPLRSFAGVAWLSQYCQAQPLSSGALGPEGDCDRPFPLLVSV
ncbi:hypothetical protein [Vasconcelosia minhoensis]|uniref:hypothetical protein n=1 Tax=Vasconcelosia minhoensis TaxID=3366354 RepID=UPI001D14AA8C|nr:hypothetical protein [Romeria gracilis]